MGWGWRQHSPQVAHGALGVQQQGAQLLAGVGAQAVELQAGAGQNRAGGAAKMLPGGGAAHPVLPIAALPGLPSRSPPRFPPQKGAQGAGEESASEPAPAGAREGRGTRALPGGAEGLGGEQDPSKPSPSSGGRKRRPAPLHGRLHLRESCSPPPGRREDCSTPKGPRRTPCPPIWGPQPLLGPNGASYRGAPSNGMEPAGTGRCSRWDCRAWHAAPEPGAVHDGRCSPRGWLRALTKPSCPALRRLEARGARGDAGRVLTGGLCSAAGRGRGSSSCRRPGCRR